MNDWDEEYINNIKLNEKDKIIYPIRNKSGKTPDLFLPKQHPGSTW